MKALLASLALLLAVTGCGSVATRDAPSEPSAGAAEPSRSPERSSSAPRRGGFYLDDGPGERPPANLADIPDAQFKLEPLRRAANRPYAVFGKEYVPLTELRPFRQKGLASWYGRRYHGQRTSSGELYDMYAMSAAHPTLPIPSYARVTNVANGRSVVVRVNDRGPFLHERIIDLSYTAAYKLGYVEAGSAEVEVEALTPQTALVAADAPARNDVPAPAKALYLQIGAFASRENAEDFRSRVARQLGWLTGGVELFSSGSLWRLHLGPYGTDELARSIAQRIEAELKLKPMLVVR